MNEHKKGHPEKSFDYDQITEEIYIGSNACCQVHFDDELLKIGIKADISLEIKKIDNPQGVDYFLWLPTQDHTPPTLEKLKLGATTLNFLVRNKIKTYVHCEHGHGRAPTLVAAYFISQGKNPEEAFQIIKSKRPEAHLNENQMSALRNFQKTGSFPQP